MPNVMAALPNTGGALCSMPVWLTPTTRVPCSNAAKTRNLLKLAAVPQTPEQISAVNGPKFTISSRHVGDVLLFNKFIFRLSTHALVAKIQPNKVVWWCRDGDFLRPVFSASRVHEQHISDLHPKFALRPHLCASMVDIQSATAEIRRGKNQERRRKKQDKNIMSASGMQVGHNKHVPTCQQILSLSSLSAKCM